MRLYVAGEAGVEARCVEDLPWVADEDGGSERYFSIGFRVVVRYRSIDTPCIYSSLGSIGTATLVALVEGFGEMTLVHRLAGFFDLLDC